MLNELVIRKQMHEENKQLMDERNSLIKKILNSYKKLDAEMMQKHEEKVHYFLSTFNWLLTTWKHIKFTSDEMDKREAESLKFNKHLTIATITLLVTSLIFEFSNSTIYIFATVIAAFFLANVYKNMMIDLRSTNQMCSFRVTESMLMRDWQGLGLSVNSIFEAKDNQLPIIKLEESQYSKDSAKNEKLDMVIVENSIIKNDIITFEIEFNLLKSYL